MVSVHNLKGECGGGGEVAKILLTEKSFVNFISSFQQIVDL